MRQSAAWNVLLLVTAILILVPLSGCDQKGEFNPIRSTVLEVPEVYGFWAYDANGVLIGSWGKPRWRPPEYSSQPNLQGLTSIIYPSPVRSFISSNFRFAVPEQSRVWMWAVRALGPADIEAQIKNAVGATYVVPGGAPCKVFLQDSVFTAGYHEVVWDAKVDGVGLPLPTGFYRVYIYAKGSSRVWESTIDFILWMGEDCHLIPSELRPYLNCQNMG
ncbi:MAG TPA: hypothetical protein VMS71_00390 [Candidatus Acidoferrum sp.]|nr:hypothetical protein [Candidatus Acidoferrum sp.]